MAATSSSSSKAYAEVLDPEIRPGVQLVESSGTRFEVSTRYTIHKPIGHGAYGVVVSAEDTKTGKKLAIKKIPNAFNDLTDAKRILREIKLMRFFNHENVIGIEDLEPPPSLKKFEDVYIISELMETDLHRIIYSRQELSDDHIQYFIYQMLCALKYLHSANVLHRDLKPSNILLNADCSLKLCDFGLARGIDESTPELTEYVVTRWYRAPEIMLSCQEYTKAIDVWSVGCIFAELLGTKPLFPGDDYIHQLRIIVDVLGSPSEEDLTSFVKSSRALAFMRKQAGKPKVPFSSLFPDANPLALDLLEKMLMFNPAKRITIEEALKHPYMESLHSPEDEPSADAPFTFEFETEGGELTRERLKKMMFDEIAILHPEILETAEGTEA